MRMFCCVLLYTCPWKFLQTIDELETNMVQIGAIFPRNVWEDILFTFYFYANLSSPVFAKITFSEISRRLFNSKNNFLTVTLECS